jgi:hypothetical protein
MYEAMYGHDTQLLFNNMIYDLILLFSHVMDQTQNHNFWKMKISQNHHIPG